MPLPDPKVKSAAPNGKSLPLGPRASVTPDDTEVESQTDDTSEQPQAMTYASLPDASFNPQTLGGYKPTQPKALFGAPQPSPQPVAGATGLTLARPPASAIPQTPTTRAAPQSESSNPLSGDTNSAPGGTTTPLASPAAKPTGLPGEPGLIQGQRDNYEQRAKQTYKGGVGDMQRQFSNPTSAAIYHAYTKNLFSPNSSKRLTPLRKTPASGMA